VNQELVLERAASTVDVAKVVDRRAAPVDPRGECFLDRVA
jgi:hypothetical protein